ncbi:hypothetical protein BJ170DRAFT_447563 [Xylariales sp. AK1849]|nr:hypothetical protein BJ170DRAFT_447563 [Xylariales sp. AK1849]
MSSKPRRSRTQAGFTAGSGQCFPGSSHPLKTHQVGSAVAARIVKFSRTAALALIRRPPRASKKLGGRGIPKRLMGFGYYPRCLDFDSVFRYRLFILLCLPRGSSTVACLHHRTDRHIGSGLHRPKCLRHASLQAESAYPSAASRLNPGWYSRSNGTLVSFGQRLDTERREFGVDVAQYQVCEISAPHCFEAACRLADRRSQKRSSCKPTRTTCTK